MSCSTQFCSPYRGRQERCRHGIRHVFLLLLVLVLGGYEGRAQDPCLDPSCRTNIITFNTGVNHNTGVLYTPLISADAFWEITSDPDPNTQEPRQADVMPAFGGWPTEPGSTWLMRDSLPNGDPVIGTTVYRTEFIVCEPMAATLDLTVGAPDGCDVFLNGMPLFSVPPPGLPAANYVLPGVPLQSGVNVLTVEVHNTSGIASGLNLTGTLSAPDFVLVSRACGPQKFGFRIRVFDDTEIDGIYNPDDDPGLPGVDVTVSNGVNNQLKQTTPTGRAWFQVESEEIGNYTVTAAPPSGYGVTVGTSHTVVVTAGGSAINLITGMSSCASVCVAKYNDLNCNGQRDPGEPFLAGWVINYSDGQQAITKTTALVCKKVCTSGTIELTEVIPANTCWKQTEPAGPSHIVTPIPGKAVTVYFGNSSTGTLCIYKFNDLDGDGTRDLSEPYLPNWQFTVTSATYSRTVTTGIDGKVCISITCGTYTVCEVTKAGWCLTTPQCQQVDVEACETTDVEFGNSSTGTICVTKFNDKNCNGVREIDEPYLEGWTFDLDNGAGTVVTVTTDAAGQACAAVPSGTWQICEQLKPGWTPTTPICPTVTVSACGSAGYEFGNSSTGTLCVYKFHDLNCNGQYDPGEPYLPNWKFRFTGPDGSVIDLVTDADGKACAVVTSGTWTACETVEPGWTPTTPGGDCQSINVAPCQTTATYFGNAEDAEICVHKFNDRNCNGTQEPGEESLPNWEFEISNGGVTITVTTGADGVTCATVTAGTWTVCEVTQAGWSPATTACCPSLCTTVTISTCGTTIVTFGNASTGTVCGFKYHDIDGDGDYNPAIDTALPNWTIELYNSSGVLVATGLTDAAGLYCFTDVPLGVYTMVEVQQTCWEQTEPPAPLGYEFDVTPCCYTIYDFGNKYTCCTTAICVLKFDDINCNGSQDPGEQPLPGWTFTITGGATPIVVTTGPDGKACVNVTAGTYTVCESTQACWKATTAECIDVVVATCQTVPLVFGNSSTGTLCMTKYNDLDCNGQRDPGEPGIPGWQMTVSGVGTFVTDLNGNVCIPVTCGTYQVCEVLQPGWTPTTVTCVTVLVTPCTTVSVTFGNCEEQCTTAICVLKFNDINCNGVQDPGEPNLSGWTMTVNMPGGGPVVATGVTGSDGRVCIPVTAGTYEVHEIFPIPTPPWCGWVQTYPISTGVPYHTVTVTTCQTVNVTFGNSSTGSICVLKFDDKNCNGVQDPGEPGIQGWQFTITTATHTVTAVTGKNGTACVQVTCGTWTICEVTRSCWASTTPECVVIDIPPCAPPQIIPFGNSSTGTLCMTKFDDINGNGKQDPGEPGIPGWLITVTGVGTFPTDPNGNVCISVTCGTYQVCEVLQPGWMPTTVTCTTISVTPCTTLNVTFGNKQSDDCFGWICGTKYWERYHDGEPCNGEIDPDERDIGLPGWVIEIYDNVSGVLVTSGTTDINGKYCIQVPVPGVYDVREVPQPGFMPTFPPGGVHIGIAINDCGEVIEPVDFLNCPCPDPECGTDSLHILSNPMLFNGNTVLVNDPSGGPVPRNGLLLLPPFAPFAPPVPPGAQWIGPNNPALMPPCPPCVDPPGTYEWHRYFCVCDEIETTYARVRLCFEGVDSVDVWLNGQLLGTYRYPNPPTCIDTMVQVTGGCNTLIFNVHKFPAPPGFPEPAGLSYEGSIVGPGLRKDECCDCYQHDANPQGMYTPGNDAQHRGGGVDNETTPGTGKADVTTTTGIGEAASFDPQLVSIPNPANGMTTVYYSLPHDASVSLDLYNSVGQHVFTLSEGRQSLGRYSVPLDMADQPSGLYNVRLTVDGHVYTIRLMNLR